MSLADEAYKGIQKALRFYSLGKLIKDGLGVQRDITDDLLLSKMTKTEESSLYLPETIIPQHTDYTSYANFGVGAWASYKFHFTTIGAAGQVEIKPDSAEFELNMVEALQGWREWNIDLVRGVITGVSHQEPWSPEEPATAKCLSFREAHPIPGEFCTCGLYALDNVQDPDAGYGSRVYGEVYGWGRYVRGDNGWRCQYAYPKSFHACEDITPEEMDILKKYYVPIYVEQPVLMYNPEEDGYEHRNDEENWNLGPSTEPNANQDSYESEED